MEPSVVHLVSPHRGAFCGVEGHEIYTRKGIELAGLKRLAEVNCEECLRAGAEHYRKAAREADALADKIERSSSKG